MNVLRRYNDDGEQAPPPAKAEVECNSCGSLLEITQKDIQEDDCGVLHHHPGSDCWIDCAVCGKLVPLNSRKLEWKRK